MTLFEIVFQYGYTGIKCSTQLLINFVNTRVYDCVLCVICAIYLCSGFVPDLKVTEISKELIWKLSALSTRVTSPLITLRHALSHSCNNCYCNDDMCRR